MNLQELINSGYQRYTFTLPDLYGYGREQGLIPEDFFTEAKNFSESFSEAIKVARLLRGVDAQILIPIAQRPRLKFSEVLTKTLVESFLQDNPVYYVSDCPLKEDPLHIAFDLGLVSSERVPDIFGNPKANHPRSCPHCEKKYVIDKQEVPISRLFS